MAHMEFLECCVNGCLSNDSTQGVDFMMLPDNPDEFRHLLMSIERQDLLSKPPDEVRENYFICSLHFPQEQHKTLTDIDAKVRDNLHYQTPNNTYQNVKSDNLKAQDIRYNKTPANSEINVKSDQVINTDFKPYQQLSTSTKSSINYPQQSLPYHGYQTGEINKQFNTQQYRSIIGGQTVARDNDVQSVQSNGHQFRRSNNNNNNNNTESRYSPYDKSRQRIKNENGHYHSLQNSSASNHSSENGHSNNTLQVQNDKKMKNETVICQKCGLVFDSMQEFHDHLLATGNTDMKYLMGRFTEKETSVPVIEQPIIQEHNPYNQPAINKPAYYQPHKNQNAYVKKNRLPNSCNICLQQCNDGKELHKHMMAVHRDYYCQKCHKTFKSRYYIAAHQQHHCHIVN